MSTALLDGTLASNRAASGMAGVDPRRRRFALNPGIYLSRMNQRASGRQDALLPAGIVTFRTVSMVDDDFDTALKNGHDPNARAGQIITDFPAAYFLGNALGLFGELGMKELRSLTLMDDPEVNEKGNVTKDAFRKSAQGYFQALWPAFSEIKYECPSGLTECATCRLHLIGDPIDGAPVDERIIDRLTKQDDLEKCEELRIEVAQSLTAYIDWATRKWAEVLGERDDRKQGGPGLAKLGPAEHHVRKNLHEVAPSESATAASFGKQVADANAEATRDLAAAFRENKGGGDNAEILKMLIEQQANTTALLSEMKDVIKSLSETKKTE